MRSGRGVFWGLGCGLLAGWMWRVRGGGFLCGMCVFYSSMLAAFTSGQQDCSVSSILVSSWSIRSHFTKGSVCESCSRWQSLVREKTMEHRLGSTSMLRAGYASFFGASRCWVGRALHLRVCRDVSAMLCGMFPSSQHIDISTIATQRMRRFTRRLPCSSNLRHARPSINATERICGA